MRICSVWREVLIIQRIKLTARVKVGQNSEGEVFISRGRAESSASWANTFNLTTEAVPSTETPTNFYVAIWRHTEEESTLSYSHISAQLIYFLPYLLVYIHTMYLILYGLFNDDELEESGRTLIWCTILAFASGSAGRVLTRDCSMLYRDEPCSDCVLRWHRFHCGSLDALDDRFKGWNITAHTGLAWRPYCYFISQWKQSYKLTSANTWPVSIIMTLWRVIQVKRDADQRYMQILYSDFYYIGSTGSKVVRRQSIRCFDVVCTVLPNSLLLISRCKSELNLI
jgi:hypothetical protein